MHYHDITKDDMKNGSGLRVVLWVSGCAHGCKDCQNPITWDPNCGLEYDKSAEEEVINLLAADYISGLTLSGGDPLYIDNREVVTNLCIKAKQLYPSKSIWLYTGYMWDDVKELEISKYIDVCVDGRFDVGKRDVKLKWRGSANQRVIDVKKSLQDGNVILYCD